MRRFGRWLGRLILAVALIYGLTLGAIWTFIVTRPDTPPLPQEADVIVCLGAGMSRTDGWLSPDASSFRRAVTCAELHEDGIAPIVIFTGYGHEISSVAAAMARVAAASGLDPESTIIEEDARSTIQNAAFSRPYLPEGTNRVVLVSDAFHLPRAGLIFRTMWPDLEIETYPTRPLDRVRVPSGRSDGHWAAREAVAIWFNGARGASYVIGGWLGIPEEQRIGWFN